MKLEAKTIDEFFAAVGEREPELRQLDEVIQQTLPTAKRQLFSGGAFTGMAYGMYHYKGASGSEGDWPAIALTPQKNYISLYVLGTYDGKYLAEQYGKKLGKVSVGKSCIRFKKFADLNLAEVKNILRDNAEWLKAQPGPTAT